MTRIASNVPPTQAKDRGCPALVFMFLCLRLDQFISNF